MTNQIQNPKSETKRNSSFVILPSVPARFRHSDFEFRVSAAARAFTLIEMITVLTIIVIVLAIAVPVWDALMNGTNLAAAQNQISAFISNARSDAIYNSQTIGVFFYIDPKTQQTAMAEVQVQTLYQPHPYGGGSPIYTSLFQPQIWNATWNTFSSAYNYPPTLGAPGGTNNDNGPVNSIELVNAPDPNNPGSFIFYRDVVLLPKGVGVALNSNTFTYNQYNQFGANQNIPGTSPPASYPALDRYTRIGAIMFAPDGTVATIPIGIPYYECFTQAQYNTVKAPAFPPENLLCSRIGMYGGTDFASNLYPPNVGAGTATIHLPLMSSAGFVVYDHDAFLNQHAQLQGMNFSSGSGVQGTIGDGSQFTDIDMNNPFAAQPGNLTTTNSTVPADKYDEEVWIDQSGTAFLVSPFNGSLIKAK